MITALRVSKTWLGLAIIATLSLLSAPLSAFACCCAGVLPPTTRVAQIAPILQVATASPATEGMACCEEKGLKAESVKPPLCHLENTETIASSPGGVIQGARLSPSHDCGCRHADNLLPAVTENRLSALCFVPFAGALPVRDEVFTKLAPSTASLHTSTPLFYRNESTLLFAGRAPPPN